MDVELYDGTVVTDVPDNMTQAELGKILRANGYTDAQLVPPAETPVKPAAQAKPQNWSTGDYGKAAINAVTNFPGDLMNLYGEMTSAGGNLIGAALNPVETTKKYLKASESVGKVGAGEVMLAAKAMGRPIKPGSISQELEGAQLIDAAKQFNIGLSNSALGKAIQGDFGPLITWVSDKPAHAAVNAVIGLRSLAGQAEKAGYTTVAENLLKAGKTLDPFLIPGKVGQAARSTARKASTLSDLAVDYGVIKPRYGKVGDVLNWYGNTPTLTEGMLSASEKMVGGATNWYGNVFHPKERWLQKNYGEDLEAARNKLETAPKYSETGTFLTPAQRTLELNRVEAPASEIQLVGKRAASEWDRLEKIRKANLGKAIPETESLEDAVAARTKANEVDYANVDDVLVAGSPTLETLLQRAKSAVDSAKKRAETRGVPFSTKLDIRSEGEKVYGVGMPLRTEPVKVKGKRIPYTYTEIDTGAPPVTHPVEHIPVTYTEVKTAVDPITRQQKTAMGYDPVTGEIAVKPAVEIVTTKGTITSGGGTTPGRASNVFERDPITRQLRTTTGYDPVTGKRIGKPVGEIVTKTGSTTVGGGTLPASAANAYSGKTLSEIDRSLNDLATMAKGTEGITATDAHTFGALQKDLREYLFREDVLPELKTAIESHASHSRNIDRIKVSSYIRDLVTDIHKPGNESRFLDYWDKVRKGDASSLIKDATGDDTFKKLTGENSLGFDQKTYDSFEKIAKDLERSREHARQAQAGSGASAKVGVEHVGIPHTLNKPGMLANFLLRLKGESLTNKAAAELADLVFNPNNAKLLAEFDKAIASNNKAAINRAYIKAKMLRAGELRRAAEKKYSTLGGQAASQFVGQDEYAKGGLISLGEKYDEFVD